MRRATRTAMTVTVCLTLMGAGLALGSPGAGAAPTPIYNAPAGGGPIETVVIKFGPFTLGPQGSGTDQSESQGYVPQPSGEFGIKSAVFDLVDEQGVPVGKHDVHLHHFVIGVLGLEDTACPDRQIAGTVVRPLIGTGMERTPMQFPEPYALQAGYGAGGQWGALWHLMNMSTATRTFYVQYTLGIQRGANASNTRFVTPFWSDARTCPAGTTWNVKGDGGPGSVETMTKAWPMPFDGYIVGVGGHLHDGGLSVTTKHEDGTLICRNDATYSGGMLDKISGCPVHDSVKKGEKVTVSSEYDNSFPHQDVMGMSVMYIWAGDQGTPPTTTTTTTSTTTTTAPGASSNPDAADLSGSNGQVLGSSAASPVAVAPAFAG